MLQIILTLVIFVFADHPDRPLYVPHRHWSTYVLRPRVQPHRQWNLPHLRHQSE